MQSISGIHKQYSNHLVLDAYLYDVSNRCQEQDIRFKAVAHLPKAAPLNDLEVVNIFTMLLEEILASTFKLKRAEKNIEIETEAFDEWHVITIRYMPSQQKMNQLNKHTKMKIDDMMIKAQGFLNTIIPLLNKWK